MYGRSHDYIELFAILSSIINLPTCDVGRPQDATPTLVARKIYLLMTYLYK